jgi:hypothetical protein
MECVHGENERSERNGNKRVKYSTSLDPLVIPDTPSAPIPSPSGKDEYIYETYTLPEGNVHMCEKLMLELIIGCWEVLSVDSRTIKARKRCSM